MAKEKNKIQKKIFLEVQNASKKFRKGEIVRTIFEKVNISLNSGEILAVIGKSGSGKTLLLQCLLGFQDLDEGDIRYEDNSFTKLTPKEKEVLRNESFSLVLKEENLFEDLSIEENLEIAQSLHRKLDQEEKENIIEEIVKLLQIKQILGKEVKNLDFLDLQKASLARALSTKPKVIFLDEPTGNLNENETDEFLNLLKSVNQKLGITMIVFSNDAKVAVRTSKVIRI